MASLSLAERWTITNIHQQSNYMLNIGKVYLWVCITNKTLPSIHGFKKMIVEKYDTEQFISVEIETTGFFTNKMVYIS